MTSPTATSAPIPSQDASAAIAYINYFQARGNRDEVFLDFGSRAPAESEQAAEAAHVTHRLALNYKTVRELSAFLNWLVQQHAKPAVAAPSADAPKDTTPAAAESPLA